MLLALIKKELLALVRDMHGLAALFFMPMVFIVLMSLTLKDIYRPPLAELNYAVDMRDSATPAQWLLQLWQRNHGAPQPLAADWQVVAGHCLDLADSSLPYLPFSEVLGLLMADRPDVAARVLEQHPTLARLQPGRRIRSSETASGDQALDRGNVYDAFGDLLATLAEQAPVLVVVEDAHWADESTRDMLSFLFSRPVPGVSLVVSYRADDLHRRHPLRRQVAEWMRLRGVDRLHLLVIGDNERAQAFYRRAGWELTGPAGTHDIGGVQARVVRYELLLPA